MDLHHAPHDMRFKTAYHGFISRWVSQGVHHQSPVTIKHLHSLHAGVLSKHFERHSQASGLEMALHLDNVS